MLPALDALIRAPGVGRETYSGLAPVESVLRREAERCAGWPVLFIHCGDLIGIETTHDRFEHGKVTLRALEELAASAGIEHCYTVVGNHEMDYGVDAFEALREEADRFRFIAGNLDIDGEPTSAPWRSSPREIFASGCST